MPISPSVLPAVDSNGLHRPAFRHRFRHPMSLIPAPAGRHDRGGDSGRPPASGYLTLGHSRNLRWSWAANTTGNNCHAVMLIQATQAEDIAGSCGVASSQAAPTSGWIGTGRSMSDQAARHGQHCGRTISKRIASSLSPGGAASVCLSPRSPACRAARPAILETLHALRTPHAPARLFPTPNLP